jgi:hypothetical protein
VVHLTNAGKTNMGFTHFIYIDGSGFPQFSQTNDCGAFLPPGGSCAITVTFKPQRAGAFEAYVGIEQNGGFTPELIPLTGTGD